MKSKETLQIVIDVIIETINKNIYDVTFENFAKILIKFNIQLQISQFLQAKIKQNACSK